MYSGPKTDACTVTSTAQRGVSASVRLSDTIVYCIQAAKDIVKLLSRPGSPIILVSRVQAPLPNSKGNPVSGSVKYTGVGKLPQLLVKCSAQLGYIVP